MSFRTRLLFCTLLCAWAWVPGRSHAQTPAECRQRVDTVLGFDSRVVARITPRTAINLGLAERIFRLTFMDGDWQVPECQAIARRTSHALYRFVALRLEWLLNQGNLAALHHELALLRPLHSRPDAARSLLDALPRQLETRYLETLRTHLQALLRESPWVDYMRVQFDFSTWTEEWRVVLGATAVAAVDLSQSRIALAPFALPPQELEYFLFHELAHLHHWQAFPSQRRDLRASESYAWARTFEFVRWRAARGETVPAEIERIRNLVVGPNGLGLARWTEAVLRGRGLH